MTTATTTTGKRTIAAACCTPVGSVDFDERDAAELAKGFAALADPVRLRLLSLIASVGAGGACVCDLIGPSGRSQPTVSHHLKVLREAGLVTSEKRGTWAWYHVEQERLRRLRAALIDTTVA
jgi:ArsR family transcriptional regulator, arsenate/arsenite/antimonite-responsive transcriptional repressor